MKKCTTLKFSARKQILAAASVLALLLLAAPAAFGDYDEPVIIDAAEAYDRSLRDGRDAVEGFWGIYMDWQPERGSAKRFRMVVVKNDYEVYDGSDYVGVVTCDGPGCKRGEIKLVLKKTDDPIKFEAAMLMRGRRIASGIAVLGPHEDSGREDSALDLSSLRYENRQLTRGLVRITDG